MGRYDLSEKEYRLELKAALVIESTVEALDAMTGIAARLIDRGLTQAGANLLVYIVNHPDVRHDTFDYADECFMELEASACPRVIEDARTFILGKTLNTMANYITTIDLDA